MNLDKSIDARRSDRIYQSSSILVKGNDEQGSAWKEQTEALSFSRTGAGFFLNRKCLPGQLVSLLVPLPRHLRAYDNDRELYRVWGLVQHCQSTPDAKRFQVGVAFVGRMDKDDYVLDAKKWYRIVGINEDGLWKIAETGRPFVKRQHSRFPFCADITLALVAGDGNPVSETESVIENVSQRGAAVLSTLNVNVGDCVRFSLPKPAFSAIAVVRNRQPHHENVDRIHLEFVTADFPVKDARSDEMPDIVPATVESPTAVTEDGPANREPAAKKKGRKKGQ
jgi:hypothetical protein